MHYVIHVTKHSIKAEAFGVTLTTTFLILSSLHLNISIIPKDIDSSTSSWKYEW